MSTVKSLANDSGQIVGGLSDASRSHSFLDTGGSVTTIDVPGAAYTVPQGINNSRQIVGYFFGLSAPPYHGFLYSGGSFTTIDIPGAFNYTSANGINDSSQIVGLFVDATGDHGFLATPTVVPEPSSLPLLAACLIGLGAIARYSRRA
jgi:hypothetical protein